jgi:hypothetical protein
VSPIRRDVPGDDDLDPHAEFAPWHRADKWWKANAPADLVYFEGGEDGMDVSGWRAWQLRRGEFLAQNGLLTPGEIRWLVKDADADSRHSGLARQAKKARYLLSLIPEEHD